MPNGKISKTEFQKMHESERQFYIWERLNMIVGIKEEVGKLKDWRKQIVGAMVILNVIVLPVVFILINKWIS